MTELSTGTLESEVNEVTEPDFSSEELTGVEVADFAEPLGPNHSLLRESTAMEFFFTCFPNDAVANNSNSSKSVSDSMYGTKV